MAHVPQRSGDSLKDNIQIQRVAGMCKPRSCTNMGFTILAVRCDTSEETRKSAIHVKHRAGCLAGLDDLPLQDGPNKCLASGGDCTENSSGNYANMTGRKNLLGR